MPQDLELGELGEVKAVAVVILPPELTGDVR